VGEEGDSCSLSRESWECVDLKRERVHGGWFEEGGCGGGDVEEGGGVAISFLSFALETGYGKFCERGGTGRLGEEVPQRKTPSVMSGGAVHIR
jgi:hypothetical protein